jgi:hypothetical protein
MTFKTTLIALTLGVAAAGAVSATAFAEPMRHPRSHEVLARDAHQRREIKAELAAGKIGPMKAHRLLAADRRIAREDRADLRAHGRLTKAQLHRMNRQEARIHRHM